MARSGGNKRSKRDKGRGFYETSSPFETFEPDAGGGNPQTFTGLVDRTPSHVAERDFGTLSGKMVMGRLDPEQYDNPRGYPGLALVTTGDEKGKWPIGKSEKTHSILHHTEMAGALTRTGKP